MQRTGPNALKMWDLERLVMGAYQLGPVVPGLESSWGHLKGVWMHPSRPLESAGK